MRALDVIGAGVVAVAIAIGITRMLTIWARGMAAKKDQQEKE